MNQAWCVIYPLIQRNIKFLNQTPSQQSSISVRSNPARGDLAKIIFSQINFFVCGCDVVLTYTIIFAALDMRCDLKIASNVCECVWNLVTEADHNCCC